MSTAGGGGIFVSYRRAESSDVAGRLGDRLIDRFGAEQVFFDVQAIQPGADFAEAIFLAVDACAVLVAVIGPGWLLAADEQGKRRLDDPDDLVRLEIGTALARGVRVIPVLVGGAVMPRRGDLPDSLAGLARRNALPIRHESFREDAGRLVAAIERVLASAVTAGAAEGARSARDGSSGAVKEGAGTGRNDPARAARLVSDAESVANSITDERWRAEALSHLAGAVAVTDPDRAARIVSEAERIANSITEAVWKAEALSEVAGAVAVTDPDRAERIANSIAEEYWKESALSEVAGVVAVTDPDRAERIANSITDEYLRVRALSEVAEAVAITAPDRAARLASDAERIANPLTDDARREWALMYVAGAVAVTDPDRAERIANSITDEYSKSRALSGAAKAVAITDPNRATRLASDAERIANSITSKIWKAEALINIAKALTAHQVHQRHRSG